MFKNFDFSWFLTIPGILTGVGCLLVIISIIIFISTIRSKKTKDSENDVNVVIPDQGVNSVPIDNNGNPLNVVNDASTNVVDNQLPLTSGIDQISVIPVENNMATDVQPVELTPVNMEPEIQPVEVAPISVEPQIQPVEVAPISVEPQLQPVEPAINNNVQVDAVNLPYGGVSPNVSVPLENPQQEKIIYGGADPLAGTGVIPVVQPQQTETSKTEEIEAL